MGGRRKREVQRSNFPLPSRIEDSFLSMAADAASLSAFGWPNACGPEMWDKEAWI